jgi:hypothetical protein
VQNSVPPANRRIVAADPSFGTPQDPGRLSRKAYDGLALDEHIVILKIHGAVDRSDRDLDSYVISR